MRKQPTRVTWDDLETAFHYVSSGSDETEAVLNRESGEIL
jgi:hypothetical protein